MAPNGQHKTLRFLKETHMFADLLTEPAFVETAMRAY